MKSNIMQALDQAFCIETNAMQNGETTTEQWIQLLPRKKVVGRDSRQWLNTKPEDVVAKFTSPIPVDYEHATETGRGSTAAAGWVEELAVKNRGEIWGLVKWTPKGLQDIQDKYWRYVSPTIEFSEATLEIQRILSVALTNRPNLELKALNRAKDMSEEKTDYGTPVTDEKEVTPTEPARDDSEETVETALNQAEKEISSVPTAVADKLGLPSQDVRVALNAISELQTRLDQAEKALNRMQVTTTAEKIVAIVEKEGAGKITPAMRPDYVDIGVGMCTKHGYEKGLDSFRAFVSRMPMVAQNVKFKPTELKDNELKSTVEGILKGANRK